MVECGRVCVVCQYGTSAVTYERGDTMATMNYDTGECLTGEYDEEITNEDCDCGCCDYDMEEEDKYDQTDPNRYD